MNTGPIMGRGKLRLAFYGDDFTGSTDALEVLAFAGVRTALFLAPPTPAMLERFGALDAIGVAGDSRAMSPQRTSLSARNRMLEKSSSVRRPLFGLFGLSRLFG